MEKAMSHVNGIPFNVDNDDFDMKFFCDELDNQADLYCQMETIPCEESSFGEAIQLYTVDLEGGYLEMYLMQHVDAWSCELLS
jgi:hypothetical protein